MEYGIFTPSESGYIGLFGGEMRIIGMLKDRLFSISHFFGSKRGICGVKPAIFGVIFNRNQLIGLARPPSAKPPKKLQSIEEKTFSVMPARIKP